MTILFESTDPVGDLSLQLLDLSDHLHGVIFPNVVDQAREHITQISESLVVYLEDIPILGLQESSVT